MGNTRGTIALLSVAVLGLAACGEKAQTAGQGPVKKSDTKAWEGVAPGVHTADGYKPGDKAAWEAHLKARAERGQNEYSHTASAKP